MSNVDRTSNERCAHTVLKFVIIDGMTLWRCGNCEMPFVPKSTINYVCGELEKITGEKEGSPVEAYARSAVRLYERLRAENAELKSVIRGKTFVTTPDETTALHGSTCLCDDCLNKRSARNYPGPP